MPQLVKYTDQICVEKNRDILFVDFDYDLFYDDSKEETPYIKETLQWFYDNNISYEIIGPFSNSGFLEGYYGRYYIDVPYDLTNAKYKLLEEYFENSDGTMKDPKKVFVYCTLEYCKVTYKESKDLLAELYD